MFEESTPDFLLQRYQRLINISQELASTLDLEALLRQIVEAAADLCQAEAASILLYDQIKGELRFQIATNMESTTLMGIIVPVDSSIAGWIVTHRQPVLLNEAQNDARLFGGMGQATNITTRSLLGVPLVTKEKVIGALEAVNKISGEFSLEDQEMLITLGAQAAVAIENSRLFQQFDWIAELVHELRTPMASLNTAAHLLLRPEIPNEQRARIVEIIRDETFRISDLASSFLDLARLESGRTQFHMETFDAVRLLEDCHGAMNARAAEKGLQLALDAASDLSPLTADRDKIKQVIINLISNAIKYNRPNGSIILSVNVAGDEMALGVSDTGPGISPEGLSHLFQKFYRVPGSESKASGTGLGLSICKRIVDAHNGRIEVQSTLNIGTTFTVYLPLKGSEPNEEEG